MRLLSYVIILVMMSLSGETNIETMPLEDIPLQMPITVEDSSPYITDEDVLSYQEIVNTVSALQEAIYPYTEEEVYLMAQIVYTEARGDIFEDQVAVATVILNRVENDSFPDTVKGVVSQKNQFSAYRQALKIVPNDDNIQAVLTAISNRDVYSHKMVYFRAGHYH